MVERRFERADAPDAGAVTIRYAPAKPGEASPRVQLDNAWFKYKLTIETLEQTRL